MYEAGKAEINISDTALHCYCLLYYYKTKRSSAAKKYVKFLKALDSLYSFLISIYKIFSCEMI